MAKKIDLNAIRERYFETGRDKLLTKYVDKLRSNAKAMENGVAARNDAPCSLLATREAARPARSSVLLPSSRNGSHQLTSTGTR